jgi:integrase
VPPHGRQFVAKMLGHNDIRMTANTYSHIRPRHLQTVADTMDGVLFGA